MLSFFSSLFSLSFCPPFVFISNAMSDRRPAPAALQTQYQRYQAAQQQRARTDQQAATAVYAQYVSAFAPAVGASQPPAAATTTRFVRGGLLAPSATPADAAASAAAAPGTSYVLGRADRDADKDDWYNPESDGDEPPPPPPPPKRAAGDTLGAVFALGHGEVPADGPVTLSLPPAAETGAATEEEAVAAEEDPDVDRELHRERERKRVALQQLQAQFAQQDRRRGGHGGSSSSSSSGSSDRASTNVFVGGITQRVTEAALFARFRAHGPIASVKIMRPRTPEELARVHTNGFVAFMCRRDAERAKAALDGALLDGCAMKLDWGSAVPLPPAPLCLARDPDTGAPVLRPATTTSDTSDNDNDEDGHEHEDLAGGDDDGRCALGADDEAALRALLDALTMANTSVRHATGWCCDHSACARAVVRVLARLVDVWCAATPLPGFADFVAGTVVPVLLRALVAAPLAVTDGLVVQYLAELARFLVQAQAAVPAVCERLHSNGCAALLSAVACCCPESTAELFLVAVAAQETDVVSQGLKYFVQLHQAQQQQQQQLSPQQLQQQPQQQLLAMPPRTPSPVPRPASL